MIAIDRLILSMPGMSPARAARLADSIAVLLAGRPESEIGTRDRLAIDLRPGEDEDADILAALAAALDGKAA